MIVERNGNELKRHFNTELMECGDCLDVGTQERGGVEEIMLRFLTLATGWLQAQLISRENTRRKQ